MAGLFEDEDEDEDENESDDVDKCSSEKAGMG